MAAEGLKHYLNEPPPVTVDPSKHVSLSAAHMLLKKQKHNKTKQKTKQNQNPQAILEVIDSWRLSGKNSVKTRDIHKNIWFEQNYMIIT